MQIFQLKFRTFERIMFGTLSDEQATEKMLMDAHTKVSEAENVGPISVDKASGPNTQYYLRIFSR